MGKNLLAAFGLVALVDYVPDRDLDLSKHAITETCDAVATTWNAGKRQVDRFINAIK